MDLNRLLMWMVYISCVSLLMIGFRRGKSANGWVLIAGLLLGLTLYLQQVVPEQAGWISGAVWGLLIFIPQRGAMWIYQLTWQHRFRAARRWACLLRWLHPIDSFWIWPRYLHAMELAQGGKLAAAETTLLSLSQSTSLVSVMARCQLFRFYGDWQGLLSWMTHQVSKVTVTNSNALITIYLMALGETHRLNQMIVALERLQPRLNQTASKDYWDLSRLIVFAFCGQLEGVTRLLKGPLAKLDDSTQQFWLSTAAVAAGEPASPMVEQLIGNRDYFYANTLLKRGPLASPDQQLTARSQDQLKVWRDDLFPELQDRDRQQVHVLQSPVTLGLIAINLALFVAEILLGGSTNEAALNTLGALVPEDVIAGDWWRLLAAAFLHFGFLHLSLNMLGLAILGPFVEKMLGPWRFLLSYLTTAIGSMLTLTLLTVTDIFVTPAAVGASGAIMGLIGTEAAIQIRILRQQSSKVAATRLRLIGLFVVLQTIFDMMTPQVSLMGHVSGLVIGFGVGCLLKLTYQTASSTPTTLSASQP